MPASSCAKLFFDLMNDIGQITAGRDRCAKIFRLTADLHSFGRLLLKPAADDSHEEGLSLAKSVGDQFESMFGIDEMAPSVHRLLDIAVLRSRFDMECIGEFFIDEVRRCGGLMQSDSHHHSTSIKWGSRRQETVGT